MSSSIRTPETLPESSDAGRTLAGTTLARAALPYAVGALEPAMSVETVVFHHSLHQRGCLEHAAALARGTELDSLSLEQLIQATARAPRHRTLYHYAAETWNHEFFWQSMRPGGGAAPRGLIAECIRRQFGAYDAFCHAVQDVAAALLGNGWLWVTWSNGKLQILTTANADCPLARGHTPLLALDLWEHAYYLDHQNRRASYVATFLEELADWESVDTRLAARLAATPAYAVHSARNPASYSYPSSGVMHHAPAAVPAEHSGARRNPQAAGTGDSRGIHRIQ
ncbi:MAG: superoxide dismutase [Gammaproteobacteria bacterium]|nr:superoxide dismutase [Gammaproteobacteria bacterium]